MRSNLTHKCWYIGFMLCLMMIFQSNILFAASTVLSWNSPTTNADGTPLSDLNGYKIYYGTVSGTYSQNIDAGNVTTYQVNNLTAGVTYYFVTTAYDTSGNEGGYSNEISKTIQSPDTTPPVMSAIQSSSITTSSVTISWTSNEAADTQIQYGTTTSYGNTTTLNASMVTSHSQSVSGLSSSTLYHYRVLSRDAAGNLTTSADYTFTTSTPPDTTPPVITAIQASSITTSSVTISWTSNEAADTQIQYGTTTSYGNTTTLNASMVTSHSQSVSGLSSSTLYHYRVLSRDAAGNLTTSADYTFTTLTPPDTTPPTIPGNVQASAISTSQVNFNWNLSTDNIAVTGYKIFRNGTQIATTSSTSYQDSGLSQATTYTYSVKAYDGAGNESDHSNTASVTTNQILLPDINVSEVLLGEDFAAGIPAAWSSEGGWRTDNSCGKTIGYPFVAPYAIADSSCTNTGSDKLTTSSFDAGSCSSVKLSFSNQYNWYAGKIDVDVSSDGGSTWTNNISVATDDGYPAPNWKDIDISAIAGSQNGKIRFNYSNAMTSGYWALDNVWVTCQTNQFQFSAQVQTPSLKTVMITNTGTSDLNINMINIAGQDASDFSIGEIDDCSNQTLLPGETCTVDVVFTPVSAGLKSASLSINSNDPDTPESNIPLAGTGTILISPAPKIKINGLSGEVVIMRGDNSPVTIELDPGSYNGQDGDWWLLMEYRKRWYYYDISTGNWKRGFSFYKQAPLEDTGTVEVTNNSRLSQGRYVYYFGVDTSMNGVQDSNEYYFETLTVNVE